MSSRKSMEGVYLPGADGAHACKGRGPAPRAEGEEGRNDLRTKGRELSYPDTPDPREGSGPGSEPEASHPGERQKAVLAGPRAGPGRAAGGPAEQQRKMDPIN